MSSTKAPASFTSVDTVATAYNSATELDVSNVTVDVPDIGIDPGATDADKWCNATHLAGSDAATMAMRSDHFQRKFYSMIFIDSVLHTPEFYKTKLKEKKFGIPKNEDVLTLAVAYHMALDVAHTDAAVRSNNSKALNRTVSSLRQLRALAPRHESGKLAVTFDPEGVAGLMKIIADNGGTSKLEAEYLKSKKDKTQANLIPLDPEDLAALRLERFAATSSGGNELVLGLARRQNDQVQIVEELRLTAAMKSALAAQFSFPNENVEFLAELLAVSQSVIEQRTDLLANRFDDPADKSAPRRFAHRHYVFNPDGSITVGPISLVDAGTIILVQPKINLLGKPVEGHVEFRTQQVHSVATNLADGRVDAFDITVEDPTNTQFGKARLVLSSQAAVRDGDGKSPVLSLLIQQVYSRSGVLPLALGTFSVEHKLENLDALRTMKDIADACGDAIKNTKPVQIGAEGGAVTFSVGRTEKSITHKAAPRSFDLNVRADDFAAATKALACVEDKIMAIDLGLHSQMLVIVLQTKHATYSIHVPAQRTDGQRSNRFMQKLEPHVWPDLPAVIDDVPTADAL